MKPTKLGQKCKLWCSVILLTFFISCETLDCHQGARKFNTVVLDAGHGGYDVGGRAVFGMHEKQLNLDITRRIAQLLEQKGYRVILTRNNDTFIPLHVRTAISNRTQNSIFISIHINWSRKRYIRGLETFYYNQKSYRLASNILRELGNTYSTPIRGTKFAKFHVLRQNIRPAVLCELGFDSNSSENKLLQNPQHRTRLAEAVVRGILRETRGRAP